MSPAFTRYSKSGGPHRGAASLPFWFYSAAWLVTRGLSPMSRAAKRQAVNALAEFESLGIAFVSLSDNLDLSTASGRLMFQIIGAMAEFERALIQERVRAGIRNARAKGRRIGRPRLAVDAARIAALRASGLSWPSIARELGVSVGTVYQAAQRLSKIPPGIGGCK